MLQEPDAKMEKKADSYSGVDAPISLHTYFQRKNKYTRTQLIIASVLLLIMYKTL